MSLLTLIVSCLLFGAALATTDEHAAYRDLKRDIFHGYDKTVRPIRNPGEAVPLRIGLAPISVNDLDPKNQILVLDTWMQYKWKDDYLTWNPKDYNNITILRVPCDEVWKPDISLYTASPDSSLFPTASTQVLVYSNGDIMWVPMFTMHTRCPLPSGGFQRAVTCNIRVGSWTYSENEIKMEFYNTGLDTTNFLDLNRDWKLHAATASIETKHYACCEEPYTLAQFNITLFKRKSGNESY